MEGTSIKISTGSPGWPATPCTCNGLWLLSRTAVSLKDNNWFIVKDQTPWAYLTRSLPAQLENVIFIDQIWVGQPTQFTPENFVETKLSNTPFQAHYYESRFLQLFLGKYLIF
jgi:hypothetical protein